MTTLLAPPPDARADAAPPEGRRALRVASALLAALVLVSFAPALGNGFVNWDDTLNFLDNRDFRGVGPAQARWAWATTLLGVYQPLAWMILGAEWSLWGLDPRGYHLASVLMHAAVALALLRLTIALLGRCLPEADRRDRRAVVAGAAVATAAFAAHPLRAEAVAWASCQPYLPCALLAVLSVLAYLRAHPEGAPARPRWLAASWLLLLAALLCKAAAVSVPAVLLILDAYPLRRIGPGRWLDRAAWREKAPFLALALAFAAVAAWAKSAEKVLVPYGDSGLEERVSQACYGVCFYAAETAWPTGLSPYYPLPGRVGLRVRPFAACALAAAGATLAAVALRRRWPGLTAAWAAYLALLAPSLGLVRIGRQLAADRYSYLAAMAPAVALAYLLASLAARGRRRAVVVAGGAAALALGALAGRQCLFWQTSDTLWNRAEVCGAENEPLIYNNSGVYLHKIGKYSEAERAYLQALRLAPDYADAHYNYGITLVSLGRYREAAEHYAQSLKIRPRYAPALNNYGSLLDLMGRTDEAEALFRESLKIDPDHVETHLNLGVIQARRGRRDEAAAHFLEALKLEPDHVEANVNLGVASIERGDLDQAASRFAAALRVRPGDRAALRGLDYVAKHRGRATPKR